MGVDQATQTVFTFTNSRRPKAASSRPDPLSLTPPKGSLGSDLTRPLTKQHPASRSWAAIRMTCQKGKFQGGRARKPPPS